MSCTSHVFILVCLLITSQCAKGKDKGDEKWKKKDVRDYSDADLERLFDQWEVCSLINKYVTDLCFQLGSGGSRF